MSRKPVMGILIAALAVAPVLAEAQGRQGGQGQRAGARPGQAQGQADRGPQAQGLVQRLLSLRAELELTETQQAQLQAIGQQLQAANAPHLATIEAFRSEQGERGAPGMVRRRQGQQMTPSEIDARRRQQDSARAIEQRAAMRQRADSLNPQQRAVMRQRADSLSPQQRAVMRQRMDSLTPEQRAAVLAEIEQRRQRAAGQRPDMAQGRQQAPGQRRQGEPRGNPGDERAAMANAPVDVQEAMQAIRANTERASVAATQVLTAEQREKLRTLGPGRGGANRGIR